MATSSLVLIGCIATVLVFVLGVLAGRKWEEFNMPPDGPVEVVHVERYPKAQEIPPIAPGPHKCAICGERVEFKQHTGHWRCSEHKGI